MRRARREAVEGISAHPGEFLRLTLLRVVHFWCGPLRLPWLAALTTAVTVLAFLGLWRILPALGAPGRAALIIPLATFPLVYYIVTYQGQYPAPLAWLVQLLAAYEVQGWIFHGSIMSDQQGFDTTFGLRVPGVRQDASADPARPWR